MLFVILRLFANRVFVFFETSLLGALLERFFFKTLSAALKTAPVEKESIAELGRFLKLVLVELNEKGLYQRAL